MKNVPDENASRDVDIGLEAPTGLSLVNKWLARPLCLSHGWARAHLWHVHTAIDHFHWAEPWQNCAALVFVAWLLEFPRLALGSLRSQKPVPGERVLNAPSNDFRLEWIARNRHKDYPGFTRHFVCANIIDSRGL